MPIKLFTSFTFFKFIWSCFIYFFATFFFNCQASWTFLDLREYKYFISEFEWFNYVLVSVILTSFTCTSVCLVLPYWSARTTDITRHWCWLSSPSRYFDAKNIMAACDSRHGCYLTVTAVFRGTCPWGRWTSKCLMSKTRAAATLLIGSACYKIFFTCMCY